MTPLYRKKGRRAFADAGFGGMECGIPVPKADCGRSLTGEVTFEKAGQRLFVLGVGCFKVFGPPASRADSLLGHSATIISSSRRARTIVGGLSGLDRPHALLTNQTLQHTIHQVSCRTGAVGASFIVCCTAAASTAHSRPWSCHCKWACVSCSGRGGWLWKMPRERACRRVGTTSSAVLLSGPSGPVHVLLAADQCPNSRVLPI